jgi:hypothetical protein
MTLLRLPPSLDRTRHTIDDEVARMRGLTPEEQLVIVGHVCRAALRVLAINPKWERVLAWRDDVPESTKRAWKRLRTQ